MLQVNKFFVVLINKATYNVAFIFQKHDTQILINKLGFELC